MSSAGKWNDDALRIMSSSLLYHKPVSAGRQNKINDQPTKQHYTQRNTHSFTPEIALWYPGFSCSVTPYRDR